MATYTDDYYIFVKEERMIDDSLRMRQDVVIEFLKLGMDYDTACTAAEVSPEMKEKFVEDEEFQTRKKFALSQIELELLRRLNKASEFSALKGDTRPTERLLEIIRPERYAKTAKVQHTLTSGNDTPKGFNISFIPAKQPCEETDPDIATAEE